MIPACPSLMCSFKKGDIILTVKKKKCLMFVYVHLFYLFVSRIILRISKSFAV